MISPERVADVIWKIAQKNLELINLCVDMLDPKIKTIPKRKLDEIRELALQLWESSRDLP